MTTINTALILWVCCVCYPAFTLLQSLALIWLIWRFRDELSWKMPDALVWRLRFSRIRSLPTCSPITSGEEPPIYRQIGDTPSLIAEVHA